MNHRSGYTYVWTGKQPPLIPHAHQVSDTDSESWEIQCLSAQADAEPVGWTRIDGSNCVVWRTTDGRYLAQLTGGQLTKGGPKQPRLFKD